MFMLIKKYPDFFMVIGAIILIIFLVFIMGLNTAVAGCSETRNLDIREYPKVGTAQFKQTLPLNDHEVVLTFDDGPHPTITPKILSILEKYCTKATFFVVGNMVNQSPRLLPLEKKMGHNIGTHSFSHPMGFERLTNDKTAQQIDQGIMIARGILGSQLSPLFRFPGLGMNKWQQYYANSKNLSIWSIDIESYDWKGLSPNAIVKQVMGQLEHKRKGIIILHDIHQNTLAALPLLLDALNRSGYKIIHYNLDPSIKI